MAITYAIFYHGQPIMVDYTPGSAVSAGDVIVVGAQLRIAHRDIASGILGALAIGFGIYSFPKTAGGSTAIAAGTVVYWDATAHAIATTSNSGANLKLGTTVGASVDADTSQYVLHLPN